jgi:hypothetical protein
MSTKEALIKKLVKTIFNGTAPKNEDIKDQFKLEDVYIEEYNPLQGIYNRAVDLYLTKIHDTYTQGYMTEAQHTKEMQTMTTFQNYDCESASELCEKKINQLIELFQHNKWRHVKIWRPLAKKYDFTRGGKHRKSTRKHGSKKSTRRRIRSHRM